MTIWQNLTLFVVPVFYTDYMIYPWHSTAVCLFAMFFFRRSLPGLLLAYSPFCSFFSFKITIRTKTGNIP